MLSLYCNAAAQQIHPLLTINYTSVNKKDLDIKKNGRHRVGQYSTFIWCLIHYRQKSILFTILHHLCKKRFRVGDTHFANLVAVHGSH